MNDRPTTAKRQREAKRRKRGGRLHGLFGKEVIDPERLEDEIAVALRDVAQWEEWRRREMEANYPHR